MHLDVDADYESEKVTIVVDGATTLVCSKDQNGDYAYRNFDKLDSEEAEEKLKKVAQLVLELSDS